MCQKRHTILFLDKQNHSINNFFFLLIHTSSPLQPHLYLRPAQAHPCVWSLRSRASLYRQPLSLPLTAEPGATSTQAESQYRQPVHLPRHAPPQYGRCANSRDQAFPVGTAITRDRDAWPEPYYSRLPWGKVHPINCYVGFRINSRKINSIVEKYARYPCAIYQKRETRQSHSAPYNKRLDKQHSRSKIGENKFQRIKKNASMK